MSTGLPKYSISASSKARASTSRSAHSPHPSLGAVGSPVTPPPADSAVPLEHLSVSRASIIDRDRTASNAADYIGAVYEGEAESEREEAKYSPHDRERANTNASMSLPVPDWLSPPTEGTAADYPRSVPSDTHSIHIPHTEGRAAEGLHEAGDLIDEESEDGVVAHLSGVDVGSVSADHCLSPSSIASARQDTGDPAPVPPPKRRSVSIAAGHADAEEKKEKEQGPLRPSLSRHRPNKSSAIAVRSQSSSFLLFQESSQECTAYYYLLLDYIQNSTLEQKRYIFFFLNFFKFRVIHHYLGITDYENYARVRDEYLECPIGKKREGDGEGGQQENGAQAPPLPNRVGHGLSFRWLYPVSNTPIESFWLCFFSENDFYNLWDSYLVAFVRAWVRHLCIMLLMPVLIFSNNPYFTDMVILTGYCCSGGALKRHLRRGKITALPLVQKVLVSVAWLCAFGAVFLPFIFVHLPLPNGANVQDPSGKGYLWMSGVSADRQIPCFALGFTVAVIAAIASIFPNNDELLAYTSLDPVEVNDDVKGYIRFIPPKDTLAQYRASGKLFIDSIPLQVTHYDESSNILTLRISARLLLLSIMMEVDSIAEKSTTSARLSAVAQLLFCGVIAVSFNLLNLALGYSFLGSCKRTYALVDDCPSSRAAEFGGVISILMLFLTAYVVTNLLMLNTPWIRQRKLTRHILMNLAREGREAKPMATSPVVYGLMDMKEPKNVALWSTLVRWTETLGNADMRMVELIFGSFAVVILVICVDMAVSLSRSNASTIDFYAQLLIATEVSLFLGGYMVYPVFVLGVQLNAMPAKIVSSLTELRCLRSSSLRFKQQRSGNTSRRNSQAQQAAAAAAAQQALDLQQNRRMSQASNGAPALAAVRSENEEIAMGMLEDLCELLGSVTFAQPFSILGIPINTATLWGGIAIVASYSISVFVGLFS